MKWSHIEESPKPSMAAVAQFVEASLRLAVDAEAPPAIVDTLLDALRAIAHEARA